MSCRVVGRTVETAFLSGLTEQARQAGARKLEGWFLPTTKNAPSKDFYARHNFQLVETIDQGSRWALDLAIPVACPPWIRLNYAGNHH
jgi:predicted enzyme involved in methoxymalonyl-ACP biosynthesis